MLETGFDDIDEVSLNEDNSVFRAVCVGRLIPGKIGKVTFEIWRRVINDCPDAQLEIVGDGPLMKDLVNLVNVMNLTDSVKFSGWLDKMGVQRKLSVSDVYFSTTLKEGGSWSFFEAAANALPVVCFKVNGPDMIVNDKGGFKISLNQSKQQVIAEASDRLKQL